MRARRYVWRLLWVKLLAADLLSRVVWLDESGFRTWMQRTHGRSKKGTRVRRIGRRRSTQYTLVMAMSLSGVRASWVFPKGLTGKRWAKFVREHLLPVLEDGELVMLDNLNIHKQEAPRKWLEDAGVLVLDQPPYSPECNPIEEAFSKLKALVRAKSTNSAFSLRAALKDAIESLSLEDIQGWVRHAIRNIMAWELDACVNN